MGMEQFKIVCRAYFPDCKFDCFGAHIDLGNDNTAWLYRLANNLAIRTEIGIFEYKGHRPFTESHLVDFLKSLRRKV